MRIMLSQPMKGKTEDEIKKEREQLIKLFAEKNIIVADTLFDDVVPDYINAGVYYLGKSLIELSRVDALFMCDGWENARGCRIEKEVAEEYGVKILYKDFLSNEVKEV